MLDLGCGDGHLLELLIERGLPAAALIGVDLSAGEVRRSRGRSALAGAQIEQSHAADLPLEAQSVGAVLSHLAAVVMDDAPRILEETRRVLRPAGVFATIVGGGPRVGDAFELFLDLLTPRVRRAERRPPELGDPRWRSADGLRALLAEGFGPVAIDDFTVDLSGTADTVWESMSTAYAVEVLTDAERLALRAEFTAALPSGRVACSMFVRRVVARRC